MVKSKILSFLKFLNILSHDKTISLSNLAVWIILVKIAISPFDWITAAGLLITLINYGHKRIEYSKAIRQDKELENKVEPVKEVLPDPKINELMDKYESIMKDMNEVKSKTSSLSVALGFKSKNG